MHVYICAIILFTPIWEQDDTVLELLYDYNKSQTLATIQTTRIVFKFISVLYPVR